MSNVNDIFFDGVYKDIWKSFIPEQLTQKEVEFMLSYFQLKEGNKVLDLMCGYGRHAIALARKGMMVTAVDNLEAYINEIKKAAAEENLPIETIRSGVLDFTSDGKFDLALCMGNSINFFDAYDTIRLLKKISSMLLPGGHLLINSWSLAEIAIKSFKESSTSTMGGMQISNESQFLLSPTRIETKSIITDKDGNTETRTGIDYLFTVNEMSSMLNEAGLKMEEVYSIPGRKKFTIGEPRAYIIATR
jgi:2-polyprenyl-3-methyl-5-hydroxy-6-metoxy-1,4-benzoquinol methylase